MFYKYTEIPKGSKIFPFHCNQPIDFEFEVGEFIYLDEEGHCRGDISGPYIVLSIGEDERGDNIIKFSGTSSIGTWYYTEKP